MLVRLHRWQPKSNRYRTQPLNLDEAAPIVEMIFRRGLQLSQDVSVDQMIMRTQQVDRILIDSANGSIDIYLSPVVERKYTSPNVAHGKTRKATETDRKNMCECHHLAEDHAGGLEATVKGLCLHPGCGCKSFSKLQRIELPKAPLSDIFTEEV